MKAIKKANKIFAISDTHFYHKNILNIRPFECLDDMHSTMIKRWNEAVGDDDVIFHLGDVMFANTKCKLDLIKKLNGYKILIMGNHDERVLNWSDYFNKVLGAYELNDVILTHIPVHSSQFNRYKLNIHGHLHNDVIKRFGMADKRYMCVSVERLKPFGMPVDITELLIDIKCK